MGTNSAATAANSVLNVPAASDYQQYAQSMTNALYQNQQANNAWSAEQAEKQMDFQREVMDFNAKEAAKNRDWQKMMSDTAHQREIADLKAAGLNPVLSAMGGNGASVGSGATASSSASGAKGDTDTSINAALVSVLSNIMDNQNKLQMANMSAINNLAVADKYTAAQKYGTDIGSMTSLSIAGIQADAQRYSADAVKAAAATSAAASRYVADMNKKIADDRNLTDIQKQTMINNNQRFLQSMEQNYGKQMQSDKQKWQSEHDKVMQMSSQEFEAWMAQNYPSTMWQATGQFHNDWFGARSGLFNDFGSGGFGFGG